MSPERETNTLFFFFLALESECKRGTTDLYKEVWGMEYYFILFFLHM